MKLFVGCLAIKYIKPALEKITRMKLPIFVIISVNLIKIQFYLFDVHLAL